MVRDNPAEHRFEARVGDALAVAEYRLAPEGIEFNHTEVPEALKGWGVGNALAEAGLRAARERGLRVLPVCPFIASYIRKHREHHDLVHPSYREALGL